MTRWLAQFILLLTASTVLAAAPFPLGLMRPPSTAGAAAPATWVPTNTTLLTRVWFSSSNSVVGFTNNQPIGTNIDNSGNALNAIQLTSTKQPLVQTNANAALNSELYDGVDDIKSFPITVGCTSFVAWSVGRYHAASTAWSGPWGYRSNATFAGFHLLSGQGSGLYIPHLCVVNAAGTEIVNTKASTTWATNVWFSMIWVVSNTGGTVVTSFYTNEIADGSLSAGATGFSSQPGPALGVSWGTAGGKWEIRDAGVWEIPGGTNFFSTTNFSNLTNWLYTLRQ